MNTPPAAAHRWGSILLLAIGVVLAGCSTVSIPRLPAWRAPAETRIYTAQEIAAAMQRDLPGVRVDFSDARYTPVNHAWLEAMVAWAAAFLRATGWTYTPESFDCEDFARAFALACNVSAGKAGVTAAPLVARISVLQRADFGGVRGSPTARHALIGFFSDRGLFVLEPQLDGGVHLVPFAAYPNALYKVSLAE